MPKKKPFTDVIYVRGLEHRAKTLNAISEKHRLDHVELARGLIEAACDFFDQHGWFTFPVVIQPEAFQAGYTQLDPSIEQPVSEQGPAAAAALRALVEGTQSKAANKKASGVPGNKAPRSAR